MIQQSPLRIIYSMMTPTRTVTTTSRTARVSLSLLLFTTLQVQQSVAFAPSPALTTRHSRFASILSAETTAKTEATSSTLVELKNPTTGQRITLIGTAHLSESSNEQVTSIIETVKPDVVMIELDRSRLERIGLSEDDYKFATSEDIEAPLREDDVKAIANPPIWRGATEFILDRFADFARGSLTNMYNDIGESMGNDEKEMKGGGEFLAAINAARGNDEKAGTTGATKIILGDRSSMVTLKRVAELAFRGGNPLGVIGRLSSVNEEEIGKMRDVILKDMGKDEADVDMGEFNVALIETMKTDSDFRNRLFGRLEMEVPEFTRAFIDERDYIMAEVIRRETDAKHVVAVVGLAHVPGMSKNICTGDFVEK